MALTTVIEDLGLRQVGSELRRVQMTRTTGYTETRKSEKSGDKEYRLKETSVADYGPGPAGGKTVVRSWVPAWEVPEEERIRNLTNINAVANRVLRECGIW